MPNVSITAGAEIILGSRAILPQQATDFSLVKPLVVDIGSGTITVSTLLSPVIVSGTVTVANEQPIEVSGATITVSTLLSPISVSGTVSFPTTQSIAVYSVTQVSTLLNNQTETNTATILLDTSKLHSLNIEIAFLTGTASSIQFNLMGYQPIAQIATSTLVGSGWLSSTVIGGVTVSVPSDKLALSNNTLFVYNVAGTVSNLSAVLTQYL